MTRPLRIALFGLFGSGNLGNGGSLDAMLRYLHDAHGDAEVTCVCAGPEDVQREFGISAFSMWWYNPTEQDKARPVRMYSLKALGKLIDAFRTLRWIRRFDVVAVPGSGVLEAGVPIRPWGLPYALLLVTLWGRLCGTKVAFVSVGADKVNEVVTRRVMSVAAALATYRSYRDENSRAAMQKAGVDTSRDQVFPDLAFGLPVPPTDTSESNTIGVGVMAYSGAYRDRHRADEIYATYVARITAFVEWLVDEGYRVRLFTGDQQDEAVALELTSSLRLRRPDLAEDRVGTEFAPNLASLLERMAKVDVVVATRFHNVVAGLKLAKPTISIGYGTKNDMVMQSMGLGEFCQDIQTLDVPLLIKQFQSVKQMAGPLRTDLLERNRRNRELLAEQYTLLSTTLFAAADGKQRSAVPGSS